jgi:light-harvesting protein B-800-850 alpha chain
MNQGKIWLVVKPTVGLPLFLGGVTVIALCVHAAILTKSDWYGAYYNGKGKAAVKAEVPATPANTSVASSGQFVAPTGAVVVAGVVAPAIAAPPSK